MSELWTAFLEHAITTENFIIVMIIIAFSGMSYALTREVEAVLATFEIKLNKEGKKKWRRLFTGIAMFSLILQFVAALVFQMMR